MHLRRFVSLSFLCVLAAPLLAHAGDPRYNVAPVAGAGSWATDINSSGQVAGNISATDAYHAFIFSGGTTTDLGSLGGLGSWAGRMNDLGQIVGTSNSSDGTSTPFIYSNGSMSALPLPFSGGAVAINNAGAITGTVFVPGTDSVDASYHPYILQNGVFSDLGTGGRIASWSYDINNLGHVAGSITTVDSAQPNLPTNAMYFHDGQMIDLGTGGYDGPWSFANALNDHDQLVGSLGVSFPADPGQLYPTLAFLYQNGTLQALGGFGPNLASWAGDINNLGQIVGGGYFDAMYSKHAFIYANGSMTDLNSLIDPATGWVIEDATAINDLGQIAGKACKDGQCYAVRLDLVSAVPEPAASAMLLAGLGVLGAALRRPARRRRG